MGHPQKTMFSNVLLLGAVLEGLGPVLGSLGGVLVRLGSILILTSSGGHKRHLGVLEIVILLRTSFKIRLLWISGRGCERRAS